MRHWFRNVQGVAALPRVPAVTGPADAFLTAVVVALVGFGVVMVYSASAVYANRLFENGHYFLVRQGVFALLGIFVVLAAARVDYHRYRAFTYPLLFVATSLMLAVALGLGRTAGGATRWIQLGAINIQPSEIAKLALILWLAYSLSKKREQIRKFSVGVLPHFVVAGLFVLLCLKQPDFGSAVMIVLLTFVLLFVAGTRVSYIFLAGLAALPIGYALIASNPYRMRRIQAFLSPFENRLDEGYQISGSLMSFGSGGATGVGIGDSYQKLFYLPEAHTDFISAIIGEELGFAGVCGLLIAFCVVVACGIRAAMRAVDEYGTYLAAGVTLFIGLQAFTNLAVALGMLPTKGLVLPFISYGGSSLLVNCAAVGILLNISRPREAVAEGDTTSGVSMGNRTRPRGATRDGGES